MVQQAVEDGVGQYLVAGQHVGPLPDTLVRDDDRAAALVSMADNLEQQMGVPAVKVLKAQLVDDEQSGGHVFASVQVPFIGGFVAAHQVDEVVGAHKGDRASVLYRLHPQAGGQVCAPLDQPFFRQCPPQEK